MNAIKLIHLNIWRRFRTRLLSTFLYYGGFAILGWVDWRIAVGVLMVLTAIEMSEGAR